MVDRYPHTVQILGPGELTGTDTGIIGEGPAVLVAYQRGRMEISENANSAYAAIFFTSQTENLDLFQGRGMKILWLGKEFNIKDVVPYQTHTEIWLNSTA